ncbi:MAG: HAMP domain-containing protein [Nitrospirae bacterium]|nr:HAMP domain-containing protein [Nitrospirota bacterium]
MPGETGTSVRKKLIYVFGCVIIATVAIIGGVTTMRERTNFRRLYLEGVLAMANQIAIQSHEVVLLPSHDLRLALDSVVADLVSRQNLDILSLTIVQADGRILVPYSAGDNTMYHHPPGFTLRQGSSGQPSLARYGTPSGIHALHVSAPILHDRTLIGRIEVDVSEERVEKTLHRSTLTLLALTLVVLVAGTALVAFFSSRLSRPLRTLTERIRRLGLGVAKLPHARRSADEIAELAAAFEQTWHNLEFSVSQINGGILTLTENSNFLQLPENPADLEALGQRYTSMLMTSAIGNGPSDEPRGLLQERLASAVRKMRDLGARQGHILRAAHLGEDAQMRTLNGPYLTKLFESLGAATDNVLSTQEMLRTVLNEAGAAIVVTDPLGRIIFLNPLSKEYLGIRVNGHMPEESIWGILHARLGWEREAILKALQAIATPRGHYEVQVDVQEPPRTVRLTAAGVWDREQILLACVFVFADVSLLAELNRRKTEVVHFMSHEMRAPLTVIQTYAEMLQDRFSADPQAEKQTNLILDHVARLRRLIDSFLDVSRIESGRQELQLARVNVAGLIEQCIMGFRPRATEKSIRLSVDISPGDHSVTVDGDLLSQAVTNLVSNAIEYSPADREVRVTLTAEKDSLTVSVVDQGYGIDEKELPNLFQKFYRATSSQHRKGKGTGLGLAFVKEVVEKHGGRVGVTSQHNSGSTFWFSLPRKSGSSGVPGLDRSTRQGDPVSGPISA